MSQCFNLFFFSNVSTTIDPIWDISLDLGPGPGSSAAASAASGAAHSAVGDPVLPGAAGSAVADLSSTANLSPASGQQRSNGHIEHDDNTCRKAMVDSVKFLSKAFMWVMSVVLC